MLRCGRCWTNVDSVQERGILRVELHVYCLLCPSSRRHVEHPVVERAYRLHIELAVERTLSEIVTNRYCLHKDGNGLPSWKPENTRKQFSRSYQPFLDHKRSCSCFHTVRKIVVLCNAEIWVGPWTNFDTLSFYTKFRGPFLAKFNNHATPANSYISIYPE